MSKIDNYQKIKIRTAVLENNKFGHAYESILFRDPVSTMWLMKGYLKDIAGGGGYFRFNDKEITNLIEGYKKAGRQGERKGWIHIWIRGKPGYKIIKIGE